MNNKQTTVTSQVTDQSGYPANLKIIKKDITTVERGVVGHGVNCQGVMGSGVAKAIKRKWPIVYENFITNDANLGSISFTKIFHNQYNYYVLYIVNMYTQEYYGIEANREYASRDAIKSSLLSLVELAFAYGIPVYTPKIGCGLGGLSWEKDVLPIYKDLAELYPTVEINVCVL